MPRLDWGSLPEQHVDYPQIADWVADERQMGRWQEGSVAVFPAPAEATAEIMRGIGTVTSQIREDTPDPASAQ